MPLRVRVKPVAILSCLVASLCACLVSTGIALAQSHRPILRSNATISGDIDRLKALPATIRRRGCPSRECLFRISPVRLTLSTPTRKNISVILDEAIDPRFVIRESHNQTLNDVGTRPLLLRGRATIRHTAPSVATGGIPVAATIYLSEERPSLELSLQEHRAGRPSGSLVTVRAPLASRSAGVVGGRARSISRFALDEMACGSPTLHRHSPPLPERNPSSRIETKETYETLYMATDFDPAWMSSLGCSSASACNDQILGLMNRASVFYERQLGLTLSIARQYGPTTHSSTTNSADLLYDFRAHNNDHRAGVIHDGNNVGEDLVDLFQLFTGRTMDQKVVGIAFTGVLCDNATSSASHMVVSHKSAAANPVITAHEIGHTLNAGHTSSGIMSAVIGASLPSSFNSISVGEMSSYYASRKFECRGGTSPGKPDSSAPGDNTSPTPIPGDGIPPSVPETMKLAVSKKGKDSYTIATSVTTYRRGCLVSVRAGTSETDADTGTVIFRVSPRSETVVKKGRVSAGIKARDLASATVYLTADYECPGNELIEVSPFVAISPNTGAQSSKRVSRRAWINLLNKSF